MTRAAHAIRIVIACVIVIYAYSKYTSKNTPKFTAKNTGLAPRILATPSRTIKNAYKSSTAVYVHNAMLNTLTNQFTQSASRNNPKWDHIVSIGDAYARGKYPFLKPNEEMAMVCYNVAEACPSARVQATARSRILDTTNNPVEAGDRMGSDISTQYGNSACKVAVRYMKEVRPPPHAVSLKAHATPPPIALHPAQAAAHDILPRDGQGTRPTRVQPERRRRNRRRVQRDFGGGSQNTHDHGVTSATKSNIKQIKEGHGNGAFREHSGVIDEAMATCRAVVSDPTSVGVSEDTYSDVYEVVTSLTDDQYSDTGLTQIQILDLALRKIKSLDETVSSGASETLCKRIATGIEDGRTVCATGKIARIVSVFEGVLEDTQKAVSIAYVEKEIAQMAVNVRDEFLDRVGPVAKEAYESTQSVPAYGTSMSEILKERVAKEYIEKLSMSPSIIEPLVALYAGSF